MEATVTLADQRQPVELYHQRWAGDLRAVPQNDLICAHRLTWHRTAASAQIGGDARVVDVGQDH
jgi:hypothetical protein